MRFAAVRTQCVCIVSEDVCNIMHACTHSSSPTTPPNHPQRASSAARHAPAQRCRITSMLRRRQRRAAAIQLAAFRTTAVQLAHTQNACPAPRSRPFHAPSASCSAPPPPLSLSLIQPRPPGQWSSGRRWSSRLRWSAWFQASTPRWATPTASCFTARRTRATCSAGCAT